jgi:hypothetical protein
MIQLSVAAGSGRAVALGLKMRMVTPDLKAVSEKGVASRGNEVQQGVVGTVSWLEGD